MRSNLIKVIFQILGRPPQQRSALDIWHAAFATRPHSLARAASTTYERCRVGLLSPLFSHEDHFSFFWRIRRTIAWEVFFKRSVYTALGD